MATISHIVRWADNTAELKKNLAQGIDQIEALRSSAEKMVQSLARFIREGADSVPGVCGSSS